MTKNSKNIKFNIMLLSGCEFSDRENYIQDYKFGKVLYESKSEKWFLYKYINNYECKAKWIQEFTDHVWHGRYNKKFDELTEIRRQGLSLIKEVIHKNKPYLFAINFGNGRFNINPNKVEDTFGIYTTFAILSKARDAKAHKAATRNASTNPKNTEFQLAEGISLDKFINSLDDNDILKNINIRFDKDTLSNFRSIIGKYGSLTINIAFDKSEIPCWDYINGRLINLIDEYESILNNEHTIYRLFKTLRPVPKQKQSALNDLLIKNLNSNNSHFYLFDPEMDYDSTSISHIKYTLHDQKDSPEKQFYFMDIEDYKKLRNKFIDINFNTLQEDKVHLIDDNGDDVRRWSVLECLYGELKVEDSIYVLYKKVWYGISITKYEQINNKIDEITKDFIIDSKEELIKNVEENIAAIQKEKKENKSKISRENIFNIELCKHLPGALLFDESKKLISIDGDKIEVCDVYNPENNEFIHAKIGTKASNLNHLFAQGYASAYSFACFKKDFTQAVNEKINNSNHKLSNKSNSHNNYNITYLILNEKIDNKLTFLSKLTLYKVITELRGFGYIVKLSWININLHPS